MMGSSIPRGRDLLRNPRFNRGTAFTAEQRAAWGLTGLLPAGVPTLDEQRKRSYLDDMADLLDFQKPYARPRSEVAKWRSTDLASVVEHVHSTIIIGTSTVGGAFSEPDPVSYQGTDYEIGQANNALVYPGIGLGTIVSRRTAGGLPAPRPQTLRRRR